MTENSDVFNINVAHDNTPELKIVHTELSIKEQCEESGAHKGTTLPTKHIGNSYQVSSKYSSIAPDLIQEKSKNNSTYLDALYQFNPNSHSTTLDVNMESPNSKILASNLSNEHIENLPGMIDWFVEM